MALAQAVTKFVQEGGAAGPSLAMPAATPAAVVSQQAGPAHGTSR